MEKKRSPSTRAKAIQSTPAKKKNKHRVGFMDLPGELRNDIYYYHFQQGFCCEFASKQAQLGAPKRNKVFKLCSNRPGDQQVADEDIIVEDSKVSTIRASRTLGRYQRIDGLDTRWCTSLTPLIFACKQIYAETIHVFYRNTLFSFDSPTRIHKFLQVPSRASLANVTKIQLYYSTYGDPKLTEHVYWKEKHLNSWKRTCKRAAKRLVNLQTIDLRIYMTERAIRLHPRLPCLKPIYYFCKRSDPSKTLAKKLTSAKVKVDTIWTHPYTFSDPELTRASIHLHELFGKALGLLILGTLEADAMADFNNAWENTYANWRHHLDFARTGW